MTVVRPNSIAGINSITVQTGQALNIHDASGNLIRNITSSTGISTFASVEITKGSGDLTVGVSTFFVDNSAGRIGIGTVSPNKILTVRGSSTPEILLKPIDATPAIFVGDTIRTSQGQHLAEYRGNWDGTTVGRMVIVAGDDTGNKDNGEITFNTAAAGSTIERLRIDSSGGLLVGHNASDPMFYTGRIQVQGTNSSTSAITVKSNQNDSGGPAIVLGKSRGSVGTQTIVQSGDELGAIYWNGADGTDTNSYAAAIRCNVDGTPGSNDMPGRLIFMTTADGASTSLERLRIDSSGRLLIGSSSSRSNVPGSDVGFQIEGASGGPTNKRFTQHIFGSGDGSGPYLGLGKHRGTSVGGNTIVVNGDELGGIYFQGADGTNFKQGAYILGAVDGTPGTNDMPGRLIFATTADGAASPTERLRITSVGDLNLGATGVYDDITGHGGGLLIGPGTGSDAGIMLRTSSSGTGRIYFGDNSGDDNGRKDGFITYNQTDRDMIFGAEQSERLRISSTETLVTGTTNSLRVTHTGGSCLILERNSKQFTFNANYGAADTFSTFNVGSGMGYKFYCNSTPYITISSSGVLSGDLNDTSDEKKKKNITSIPDGAIANIKQLRPVTFNWKDPENSDKKSGFIAQEVKPIIPNLVVGEEYDETENTAGYSIRTPGVVAHLTKALQEALVKIETLETKVAALEAG